MPATKRAKSTKAIEIDEIQPLDDRILIRRIQEVTSSIIIIPDCAKAKATKGVVLAAGQGKIIDYENGKKVRRPMGVKPGDVVTFGPWDDLHGKLGGDFCLISEGDVRVVHNVRADT